MSVNVVVTNPDTQDSGASGNGAFTYVDAPTVSAITPSTGFSVGGTSITDLHGTGFVNGCTVTIGGTPATGVHLVSSTQLTCTAPAGSGGVQDVVVTNPDTQDSGASGDALYTYVNAPVVTAITPSTGRAGGGESITDLHGTDFQNGATVDLVAAGTHYPCTSVAFVSSSQLTCVTPVASGGLDVLVTNPDTQDSGASGAALYTATGPRIDSISAPFGSSAGGDSLAIFGSGLGTGTGGTGVTVTIGGASATVTGGFGGFYIYVTTPSGSVGPADIVVTYGGIDSGISGDGLFTYGAPPVVTSITPATGKQGGGVAITDLHGTDFVNGCTVTIDGIPATSVTFISSTQLTCVTPSDGNSGAVDVIVTNPSTLDSGASGAGAYTLTTGPHINSVSQPTGTAAGGDVISISGTGLCAMFGGGATVTVGGNPATVNSGFGGINLSITTPAGSVGPADIVVTYLGVDSGISGDGLFTYV